MRICCILFALSVLLFVSTDGANVFVPEKGVRMDTLSGMPELPLPSVPPELQSVPERAAYVLAHFWDGMDFRDTLRSHNKAFIEQNFVNFVSLFPHASGEDRAIAVRLLLKAAEADVPAYRLLAEVAGKYLYDTDSPMLCEEYYILFLEEFVTASVWDEVGKVRFRYLLEAARKNRPGTPAADFTYVTREGKQQTLYGTLGGNLLLIFYDPACDYCQEVMTLLRGDVFLCRQVRDKRLTVLAVCVDTDREIWELTKTDLPAEWIAGFDAGNLQEKELYVLSGLPTFYLLDAARSVVLKEILPQVLIPVLTAKLGG